MGDLAQLAEARKAARRAIPPWVKGIILGLLHHVPAKKRDVLDRFIDQELPGWIVQGLDKVEVARKISRLDPRRGSGHSPFTLKMHARLVWTAIEGGDLHLAVHGPLHVETLPPLPTRSSGRLGWFKAHLQTLFRAMTLWECGERCRPQTIIPRPELLDQWSHTAKPGELVAALIAYYHRLGLETVQRRLNSSGL